MTGCTRDAAAPGHDHCRSSPNLDDATNVACSLLLSEKNSVVQHDVCACNAQGYHVPTTPASYGLSLTSTSTPAGRSSSSKRLMVSSDRSLTSSRRLCVRISNCSRLSLSLLGALCMQ